MAIFKCLNEVEMPFTHRSEAFVGKPILKGGDYYVKSTEDITLRLVDKVRRGQDLRGRTITMDNLYSSIPLCNKLLDRKISMVGTMRHDRVGLPKEVKQFTDREPFSTQIWWEKSKQQISLTSYVVPSKSKGRKNVIVLSSQEPYLGVTKDEKLSLELSSSMIFLKVALI